MTFPYRTKPFDHQREALRRSARAPAYALLMEQGTGKTKVALDNIAYLWLEKQIDGVLLIAPNGVHRNWVEEEIPTHMPGIVPVKAMLWRSARATTKAASEEFKALLRTTNLAFLAMNVDAIITKHGKAAANTFVRLRKCMLIVDESTDIKTPGAKRTMTARALAKHAPFRRILTGTAVAESPLDAYAQFAFLDPRIIGIQSFTAFKNEFAEWELRDFGQRNMVPTLKRYKNLDKLRDLIAPYSYRVLKQDVLDLPQKLYQKRYFDLSPVQRRMYDELRHTYMTELGGREIIVPWALTRMLRLQQITCGYIAAEADQPAEQIPGPTPRLDALRRVIEECEPGTPMIIWARFTRDIDQIVDLISKMGLTVVRYDGPVNDEDRAHAIRAFQGGEAQFFAGNPEAGGRGLTLHAAKVVVYYSNYFGLETRLQSEDRAHRIGLKHNVLYIDLIAEGTVDERIVRALRSKKNIADEINGDPHGQWI